MLKKVQNFLKEEEGATMVEYALMVALIAVATITIIGTMQDSLETTFSTISGELDKVNPSAPAPAP